MNRALALVLGSVILAMPTAAPVWAGAPAAAIRFDIVSDWADKVWKAAAANDRATLDQLFANRPEGVDADGRLAKSVELLKTSYGAREAKREEATKRASRQLDRALAEADRGGLAISQALKYGVELHMLSTDKPALMREERLQKLVERADAAARAAEAAGDWLTASELFYRLDLLLEDKATYKADVKRESQRLAMIRMYAPKRMWELRNERRNAEIAWDAAHKDDEADPADGDSGARQRERRPLPPYNPKGDGYEQKLEGITEGMVEHAVNRAMERHVERVGWEAALRSGLDAIRTMVRTPDLRGSFPGLEDETARDAFLKFLDEEEQRLVDAGEQAGPADLAGVINRLPRANDRTVKLPRTALLHELGNGIFAALDEYSGVIWPDEIRRFNRNTQAQFKGVGVQIELDAMSNIRVVTPLDGTPAQRAGIRAGDLIKKVDGDSTEGFTLDQAVDVITGPGDTVVTLTVEREVTEPDGTKKVVEKDFPLVRKNVPIVTVKGWKRSGPREDDWDWFIDQQDRIGYVRLLQFSDNTDERFDRAITQMKAQGLNGLILDLRYNPGGLLDQAVAITSRFVDGDTRNHNAMVVTTHNKENKIVQRERMLRGKAALAGIPVVVLINEGSASASEIVSGAIQDYAERGDVKAVLLGARTYGKGSVQNVWGLAGNAEAAVKVTTQYYHLPADRMIHRLPGSTEWGVNPDLTVEMLPSQLYDALTLRQNADVLRLDEQGNPDATEKPANPEDLIAKGMDVQLHQALVLLQAQAAAKPQGQVMIEKPAKTP